MRWSPAAPEHDEASRRPWALVTAGLERLRVVTSDGEVREALTPEKAWGLLASLGGHVCYARTPWRDVVTATGDAREWTLDTWKREAITTARHNPTGVKIKPMAGLLPKSELDALDQLREWRAWLRRYGIPATGLSTAATRLLTTTLETPVRLDCPVNPRAALRGGRMHAPNLGRFRDVRYSDLKAAYPHALASMPVVTAWTEPAAGQDWLGQPDGFAYLTATLPDDGSPWGSLPVSRETGGTEWPADGRTVEGLWTLDDVRVGLEAGIIVDQVHHVIVARSTRRLWDTWWERAMEGRTHFPANKLVKSTVSRLWGSFALKPSAGKLHPLDRWCNETEHHDTHDPDAPVPRALARQAHVAALTAARVRARMYTEALSEHRVVYADTDGVVTPMGERVQPHGDQPGEWRTMATLETLDVAGPQMIRYLEHSKSEWRYATSGVPPAMAATVFRELETGNREEKPVLDVRRNRVPN